jgi:hypothetical protein
MTGEVRIFEVVANPRRRWTIGVLALTPRPEIGVEELAEMVAEFEFQQPTTEETKYVRTSLRHGHLEQLEAAGVITVGNDRVSRGPRFTPAVRLLTAGLACEWER